MLDKLNYFMDLPAIKAKEETILEMIREKAQERTVILGLSGGLDSALCVKLCKKALSSEKVYGVIMPSKDSDPQDLIVAREFAKEEGICYEVYALDNILNYVKAYDLVKDVDWEKAKQNILNQETPNHETSQYFHLAKIKMRARAFLLSVVASELDAVQCCTLNRSEFLMGWYDRYGDGVGDFAPIFDLYKTQIKAFAQYLKLPSIFITRPAWCGNYPEIISDEQEAGMSFEALDCILYLYDSNADCEEISKVTGYPMPTIQYIFNQIKQSKLKWHSVSPK